MLSELETFCERHDLPWTEQREDRFEEYLELLLEFSDSMNLIGPLDRGEIVDELFIDSLVPAAARPPRGPTLDVGTGAGLPGIPLKIAYPDVSMTLVDPRRKRTTFLQIAIQRLELSDVKIARTRIEEFEGGPYDYAVSKAFRAPPEWLRTAAPYRAPHGVVVCMTTTDERTDADAAADALDLERLESAEDLAPLETPPDTPDRAVYIYG